MCHYHIVITAESGDIECLLVMDVLPSNGTLPYTIILSLQPNHHFNVTITAYNSYGNVSCSISISKSHLTSQVSQFSFFFPTNTGTHDVIAAYFNLSYGTDIACVYNAASYAIGCLVNLTNIANGISYCVTVQRFSNVYVSNLSLCQSSNTTFGAGRYLVKVYDIANDGNISELPAVVQEISFEEPTKIVFESSLSCIKLGIILLIISLECAMYPIISHTFKFLVLVVLISLMLGPI